MPTLSKPARYRLPKKAIKIDCPQCGPRHRKTLSRYVDTTTGEPLPESYGRCDRESNCGYDLNPYHKGPSGMSYADEVYQQWKEVNPLPTRMGMTTKAPQRPTPPPIHCLPAEVLTKSLGHYDQNQLARFLSGRFGYEVAAQLLQRFQIGTSSRWPGACVFWLVDEQDRVRGGQIALYDQTGHKVKYTDKEGNRRVCITSVRAALKWKYRDVTPPDWLAAFPDDAETWPVVFGLPQLQTTPVDMPIAIVEGPKTAIICSQLLPGFVWLAVGGKSYLKAERLAALRGRKIMLYPDLNAYADWQKRTEALRAEGFDVTVSDVLEQEQVATDEDRENGLDLADFLLREPVTIKAFSQMLPGQKVGFDERYIERLTVSTDDDYPPEWDKVESQEMPVTIRAQTFHEWQ